MVAVACKMSSVSVYKTEFQLPHLSLNSVQTFNSAFLLITDLKVDLSTTLGFDEKGCDGKTKELRNCPDVSDATQSWHQKIMS